MSPLSTATAADLALYAACLRALPLALCMPLPGWWLRIAFGLVLALAGASAPTLQTFSWDHAPLELFAGVALGLLATLPVWAARWAGGLVGVQMGATRDAVQTTFAVIAWLAFCAARGPQLLLSAYLASYKIWPTGQMIAAGHALLALTASLALPSLLAVGLVELCAGLVQRFERSARLPLDARALASAVRPLVVALLLAGSLAAFTQSVAAATRMLR